MTPAQSTETVVQLGGTTNLGPFGTVFYYSAPSDVVVTLLVPYEADQLLALGTGYTLNGPSPLTAGGQVTLSSSVLAAAGGTWPAGYLLAITRVTPLGQPSTFGEAYDFDPSQIEAAIDALARQIEELAGKLGRTVRGAPGETLPHLPPAAERANGVFGWDENGQPVVLGANTSQAPSSGVNLLIPSVTYAPDTSTSSPALSLPPLSTIGEGMWFEIYDAMNNAPQWPISVQAYGSDQISDHGALYQDYVINNANTITRFTKRNGQWRVMQYGG